MDSFSRDNFLGKIVKSIADIPEIEVLDETMELLDDEIENNSKTRTDVSGEAKLQFQVLPIRSEPSGFTNRFSIASIFIYSFNNLVSLKCQINLWYLYYLYSIKNCIKNLHEFAGFSETF